MRKYVGVHELEMVKARVRVEDGEIRVLEEPKLRRCPLRSGAFGHEEESRESIERVLRKHMEELGLFSTERVLELTTPSVSWGAHEMLADCLDEGVLDAAVVMCDGAGSVVAPLGRVVRAVGAVIPVLESTTPIPETQRRLQELGCMLASEDASIDQLSGAELALEQGYRRVGVVVPGERAEMLEELTDPRLVRFVVHTSGIGEEEAELISKYGDVVWSCASRVVRERIAPEALLQLQSPAPVFALTKMGKRCVLARVLHCDEAMLVQKAELPVLPPEIQPEPLL